MVTRRDNRDTNNNAADDDDSSLFRFQRRRHAGGCCYWGDGNQGGSRHGRHGSRRLQCWFALALVTFLVFEKVMVTVFLVVQEAPPPPLSSSSILSLSSSSSLFFHRPESNVVNKVSASSSTSSSSSLPCPTHFYRDDHGSGSSSSTHNTEREEILLESPFAQARQQKVVIVFVCNARYAPAVASSIVSVRIDGGYNGDIAVILEESHNFTVADLKRWIRMEEEAATVAATAAPTVTTNHRPDQQWAEQVHVVDTKRLFFYTVSSLMDSLLLLLVQENDPNRRPNSSSSLSLDYLRHAPMASSCKNEYRTARQSAYYHKPLIYHPTFLQWHRVLYMDACMTFHLPLVSDLFTLPSISPQQHPVLLAAPDPWPWSQHGLWGQVLKCERNNLTRGVQTLVDMVRRHNVYYDYDDPNHQKELEQERAKVAKKQKLQQQKQRRQRNLPLQSQDNPRLVGQKNHIHNNYTFLHSPADQNQPDLEYARWVLRHAPYFNSALILYDTAILRRNDQPFDHADADHAAADHAAAASTLVELYQLYHTLGQVFRGGDQCIQSVYWMYLQRQKHQSQQQQQQQQLQQQPLASTSRSSSGSVYQLLPLQMVGQNNLVPYEFWSRFLPQIPRIITSGHATRPVCRERRTNQWMLKHNQNHNNNNNKNNHKKQK